jgi:6-phosphogluconate dehydrogenase
VADAADAVRGARICAFAQGMDLIAAGSAAYGWSISRAEVARIWMGGCIIRSRFLRDIRAAFTTRPELANLILDDDVAAQLDEVQDGWRRALGAATRLGIPAPAWSAGLAYLDTLRAERLPQNLIQAQRDYFGAHTYVRRDDPERASVHTDWSANVAPPLPPTVSS